MKIFVTILLLSTASSAMALGEAIQIYRENHPNQSSNNSTSTNTTVIYTNPEDSTDTNNAVIYAPTTTNRAVVAPGQSPNHRGVKGRALENQNNFQHPHQFNREGSEGREFHRR